MPCLLAMADEALRALVRQRADQRCEYCRILQEQVPFVPFHVDHIIPRKHGGRTHPSNLALSCMHCNLHKSSDLSGIDPEGGAITSLFHPRRDRWEEHFAFQGTLIVGLTPVGRATVRTLLALGAGARRGQATRALGHRARWRLCRLARWRRRDETPRPASGRQVAVHTTAGQQRGRHYGTAR